MSKAALIAHLQSDVTHVCQCWLIKRSDGATFGFTDHDCPLVFDGKMFQADSGMSAKALQASTGLSVDNTEAIGLLQSNVIDEADIIAGRFDGAEVFNWLVQWDNVENRQLRFAGTIGEITRQSGQFMAELRGVSEGLNQPLGRSYLRSCSAVLGDDDCAFNLNNAAYRAEIEVISVEDNRTFTVAAPGFNDRWFEQGKLTVLDGDAEGLTGAIKHDRKEPGGIHVITLWHPLRAAVQAGQEIRLDAGCDKRAETCRQKFGNFVNFRGFPDIPGDDWMMSVPRASGDDDGGSLTR